MRKALSDTDRLLLLHSVLPLLASLAPPSISPTSAGKYSISAQARDAYLSRFGMLVLELWDIVKMLNNSVMNGRTDTPATATKKPKSASNGRASSRAPRLVSTFIHSTRKSAKAARTGDKLKARSVSGTAPLRVREYQASTKKAKRQDR